MFNRPAVSLAFSSLLLLALTGCSISAPESPSGPTAGAAIHGTVHGGQQPISGASIQLYAAGTTGYGVGATALLSSPVITGSDGSFTLTGAYTCPSSSSELYLVATGGNPGLPSGSNSAIALAAALGPCNYAGTSGPTLDPSTYIVVNEATTVATVYSLAQFWQPNSFTVGTSSTNSTGLANAFTTAATLVDNSTGTAYATVPPLNTTTVPQSKINTLADILAACINTNGTDGTCGTLFSAVAPQNATAPTNTISALLDIALSPATGASSLFALSNGTAPFQPTLSAAPTDFTLAEVIHYPGAHTLGVPQIDSHGNVWTTVQIPHTPVSLAGIIEVSPSGDALSGTAPGYTNAYLASPTHIAIDGSDNIWVSDLISSFDGIFEFSSAGVDITPSGGIMLPPSNPPYNPINGLAAEGTDMVVLTGSGGNDPYAPYGGIVEVNAAGAIINGSGEFNPGPSQLDDPKALALDSSNTIWAANSTFGSNASLFHVDFSGNPIGSNPITGGGLFEPVAMATDQNRNVWVVNPLNSVTGNGTGSVSEFDASGTALSPSTTGFMDASLFMPQSIAIDGDSNVWIANSDTTNTHNSAIVKLSSTGTVLSGPTGYSDASNLTPTIAIDASGNMWLDNAPASTTADGTITKFIGIAAPVATPLGINGSYGQRP